MAAVVVCAAFSASQLTPTGDALEALAALTKLTPGGVKDFFTRQRAQAKRKASLAAAKAGNAGGASAAAAAPEPVAATDPALGGV